MKVKKNAEKMKEIVEAKKKPETRKKKFIGDGGEGKRATVNTNINLKYK